MSYLLQYEGMPLPLTLRYYFGLDWATMEIEQGKREPDYTEIGVWGMDHKGDLWAVDWWSGQTETDVGLKNLIRLIRMYKPVRIFNEGGLIDKALGPVIRDAMRRNQAFSSMQMLSAIGDKTVKLQAFHARYTSGTIHFPLRTKWAERVIDQLCRFPGGRWDDCADVCGLIGRGVDLMHDAQVPYEKPKDVLTPFTERWLFHGSDTEKPKVRYF